MFDEEPDAPLHGECEAEIQRLQAALTAIRDLKPRPFAGIPADWNEQVAACEECQRYKGHPIQNGICDTHRQPLWARERHGRHEEAAIGYRAKDIAREALQPSQAPDQPQTEKPHA